MTRRFALVDRDGTINEERHHLRDPEQLALIPGAADALIRLRDELDMGIVVVTNQAEVGRGNLAIEDLGDLVELPLLAVLATYRRDGSVMLSPVWHEWRDGGFTVATRSSDGKVKHMQRDPRASIVVCEHTPPYRGVELRTTPRFIMGSGQK